MKAHPFFRGVNWKKLEARELESKFKPGVKCSLVSSHVQGRRCSGSRGSKEDAEKSWIRVQF